MVNTYFYGNQVNPVICQLITSDVVIVWQSEGSQDGNLSGIFGSMFTQYGIQREWYSTVDAANSNTITMLGEVQINDHTENVQRKPSITQLGYDTSVSPIANTDPPEYPVSGGFFVAWESYFTSEADEFYGIYGKIYDLDGVTKVDEFNINTYYKMQSQNNVDVGLITATKRPWLVAVWESEAQSPDIYGQGIFGQIITRTGGFPIGSLESVNIIDDLGEVTTEERQTDFIVNTQMAGDQTNPKVIGIADGGFVVTYTSLDEDGKGIMAQRFNQFAVKVAGEFLVNTYQIGDQYEPQAERLSNDNFVIVWISDDQDGDGSGIYGQVYSPECDQIGTEFRVNTSTAKNQILPALTKLNGGSFVVLWETHDQEKWTFKSFFQRFNHTGAKKGPEHPASLHVDENQPKNNMIGLSNGNLMMIIEHGGDLDGSGRGMFMYMWDMQSPTDQIGQDKIYIPKCMVGKPQELKVARMHTVDPNPIDTYTYVFIYDMGETNNDLFKLEKIDQAEAWLIFQGDPNYTDQSEYSVRIKSTDSSGNHITRKTRIFVVDMNQPPTDLYMSRLIKRIPEKSSNIRLMSQSTLDCNDTAFSWDKFSYALTEGEGDTDNWRFMKSNDAIYLANPILYERDHDFSIRIRVTDRADAYFEKVFSFSVPEAGYEYTTSSVSQLGPALEMFRISVNTLVDIDNTINKQFVKNVVLTNPFNNRPIECSETHPTENDVGNVTCGFNTIISKANVTVHCSNLTEGYCYENFCNPDNSTDINCKPSGCHAKDEARKKLEIGNFMKISTYCQTGLPVWLTLAGIIDKPDKTSDFIYTIVNLNKKYKGDLIFELEKYGIEKFVGDETRDRRLGLYQYEQRPVHCLTSDPITLETNTNCGNIAGYNKFVKCSTDKFPFCDSNDGNCKKQKPKNLNNILGADYDDISPSCVLTQKLNYQNIDALSAGNLSFEDEPASDTIAFFNKDLNVTLTNYDFDISQKSNKVSMVASKRNNTFGVVCLVILDNSLVIDPIPASNMTQFFSLEFKNTIWKNGTDYSLNATMVDDGGYCINVELNYTDGVIPFFEKETNLKIQFLNSDGSQINESNKLSFDMLFNPKDNNKPPIVKTIVSVVIAFVVFSSVFFGIFGVIQLVKGYWRFFNCFGYQQIMSLYMCEYPENVLETMTMIVDWNYATFMKSIFPVLKPYIIQPGNPVFSFVDCFCFQFNGFMFIVFCFAKIVIAYYIGQVNAAITQSKVDKIKWTYNIDLKQYRNEIETEVRDKRIIAENQNIKVAVEGEDYLKNDDSNESVSISNDESDDFEDKLAENVDFGVNDIDSIRGESEIYNIHDTPKDSMITVDSGMQRESGKSVFSINKNSDEPSHGNSENGIENLPNKDSAKSQLGALGNLLTWQGSKDKSSKKIGEIPDSQVDTERIEINKNEALSDRPKNSKESTENPQISAFGSLLGIKPPEDSQIEDKSGNIINQMPKKSRNSMSSTLGILLGLKSNEIKDKKALDAQILKEKKEESQRIKNEKAAKKKELAHESKARIQLKNVVGAVFGGGDDPNDGVDDGIKEEDRKYINPFKKRQERWKPSSFVRWYKTNLVFFCFGLYQFYVYSPLLIIMIMARRRIPTENKVIFCIDEMLMAFECVTLVSINLWIIKYAYLFKKNCGTNFGKDLVKTHASKGRSQKYLFRYLFSEKNLELKRWPLIIEENVAFFLFCILTFGLYRMPKYMFMAQILFLIIKLGFSLRRIDIVGICQTIGLIGFHCTMIIMTLHREKTISLELYNLISFMIMGEYFIYIAIIPCLVVSLHFFTQLLCTFVCAKKRKDFDTVTAEYKKALEKEVYDAKTGKMIMHVFQNRKDARGRLAVTIQQERRDQDATFMPVIPKKQRKQLQDLLDSEDVQRASFKEVLSKKLARDRRQSKKKAKLKNRKSVIDKKADLLGNMLNKLKKDDTKSISIDKDKTGYDHTEENVLDNFINKVSTSENGDKVNDNSLSVMDEKSTNPMAGLFPGLKRNSMAGVITSTHVTPVKVEDTDEQDHSMNHSAHTIKQSHFSKL